MYELITIAFSHYCEKARWALDRQRIPYRERRYMPLLHMPAARRALAGSAEGASDRVSSRYSTPILKGDGVLIADSSRIARFADPSLFEVPEAAELDTYFSEKFGSHIRRMVYWFALRDRRILYSLAARNVSAPQALFFRGFFPFGVLWMRKALAVDEAGYLRSRDRVWRIADEVAERVRDGRPFLLGDRFSAADLSFVALSSPGLFPGPNLFGANLGSVDELGPGAASFVREFRAHPAGVFAQRVLEAERWPRS